jgi:hypothetical protein
MAISTTPPLINQDAFLARLSDQLNEELVAAAEPVVQQAVKDAEAAIRKRLGVAVVGLLEQYYRVERHGQELRITVRHDWPNGR